MTEQPGIFIGAKFKDLDGSYVTVQGIKEYEYNTGVKVILYYVSHQDYDGVVRVSHNTLMSGESSRHFSVKNKKKEVRFKEHNLNTKIGLENFKREEGRLGMLWHTIKEGVKHPNWSLCPEWEDYLTFKEDVTNSQGYSEYGSARYPELELRHIAVDNLSEPRIYSPDTYGVFLSRRFLREHTL